MYSAYVLSTLLCGCESWTIHASQEHKLNVFHMRCLRRILNIKWQDGMPNSIVLRRAGIPSMYSLLMQRRLHWLGHIVHMDDGRIPRDLLYGEASTWQSTHRKTTTSIQLQKGHEGLNHQHKQMGDTSPRSSILETSCKQLSLQF